MAIKRRYGKYVRKDAEGGLIVKTPAVCVNWNNEFRKHIVKRYITPNTLIDIHMQYLLERETKEPLKVMGKQLLFTQKFNTLDNYARKVLITTNEVQNLTDKKGLILIGDDPAMRILIVYSFLTGEDIPGVPHFDTYSI